MQEGDPHQQQQDEVHQQKAACRGVGSCSGSWEPLTPHTPPWGSRHPFLNLTVQTLASPPPFWWHRYGKRHMLPSPMEKATKITIFSLFSAWKWFGILVIRAFLVLKPRDMDVGWMVLFPDVGSSSTGSMFLAVGSGLGNRSMESPHWFHS